MKRSYSVRSLMIFVSVFVLCFCGGSISSSAQRKKSRTIAKIKEANGQVCFKIQSQAGKKADKNIEFYIDGKAAQLSDVERLTAEELSQILFYQEDLKIDFRRNPTPLDSLNFIEFGCHHINGHNVKVSSTGRKPNFRVDCSHCIMPKFLGYDTDFFRIWLAEQVEKARERAYFSDGERFFLFFRIDPDGNVEDIRITSESANSSFIQLIHSIMEHSPKWSPESCGGIKHPNEVRLPIVIVRRLNNPNHYNNQSR